MSYRIINNVIYIGAGETATYDVRVIDRSTGAPYIIPAGLEKPLVSFVVRPSVYGKTSEAVIKKYIWIKDELLLDDSVIYDYDGEDWEDDYGFKGDTQPKVKAVYKKKLSDNSGYEYRYYDPEAEEDKWKVYDFRLVFPFYHEDTIDMAPKQYKYEITLFAGPNLQISDDGEGKKSLKNFNYKEILQSHSDFIVEGTLSE
jgi:hypothetical protein